MVLAKELGSFASAKEDEVEQRVWMTSWNHNGSLLASCGDNKAVHVWKYNKDATGTSVIPRLQKTSSLDDSHTRAVRCVNFSHCGKYLASASFDAAIVVYELQDGDYMEVNKLEGHEHEVKCCAFSPSDEFLASCSRDKSVWFWQMDEDDDFQVSSILQPHTQDVKFVCWHPSAELLVSCSYDYSIRLFRYDGEDWITQQKIDAAHEGTVWCADFDSEGDRLVTVGEDRTLKIWQRKRQDADVTKDEWREVCSHTSTDTRWPFFSVSWNKTTGLIAVGCGDYSIRFFSVNGVGETTTIAEELILEGAHGGDVNCVAWNPADPSVLVSCSDDSTIKLWKIDL